MVGLSTPVWAQASFQPLGDLPGGRNFSAAYSVSGDGETVVGLSETTHQEAFVWTANGGMQGLGSFGTSGYTIRAEGVSSSGTVVGLAVPSPRDYGVAFAWSGGAIRDVGDLPGGETSSWAWDVSETGVIVGTGIVASGEEAFREDGSSMQGLGVFPGGPFASSAAWGVSADGAVAVGRSRGADGWEAFRWTAVGGLEGLGVLPGGDYCSEAYAASADGTVIVGMSCAPGDAQPFRWTAVGGMVGLGRLPGNPPSYAFGVSADGSVVVGKSGEAFVWTAAQGMRPLKALLEGQGVDLTAWTLVSAKDVSADGTVIVGEAISPDGDYEGYRAVVPLEATLTDPSVHADVPRLTVAPNPATRNVAITLELPVSANVLVEVLDALGRVVYQKRVGELGPGPHAIPFDAGSLPAGFYYVRMAVGSTVLSRSMIVAR